MTELAEPRSWSMHGVRTDRGVWVALGSEWFARQHLVAGRSVEPVTLTEDPEGGYLGWLGVVDRLPQSPVMVQHRKIFEVQFPYGSAAEVSAGRGEVVRLRVEVRDA